MDTLLLDTVAWDLVVDVHGDIAAAHSPYSIAQDAASAVRTFLGEVYYDTTLGVDYSLILGQFPSLPVIKSAIEGVAKTVPGVASVKVIISSIAGRTVSGQLQITSTDGTTSAANFGNTVQPPNPDAGKFKLDFSKLDGSNVLGS